MDTKRKIKRARDILLSSVTENKRLIAQILEFSDIIESILSDYEMEILSYQVAIRKEIESERWITKIMEMYGIELSTALSGWDDRKLNDHHNYAINNKIFRVPEKLKNYIDWDKIEKEQKDSLMDELIKNNPDKEQIIRDVFK